MNKATESNTEVKKGSQRKYSEKLIANIFSNSKDNPLSNFYLPGENPVSEEIEFEKIVTEKKKEFEEKWNEDILNTEDCSIHPEYANYLQSPPMSKPKSKLKSKTLIIIDEISFRFSLCLAAMHRNSLSYVASISFFLGLFLILFPDKYFTSSRSMGFLFVIIFLPLLIYYYKQEKRNFTKNKKIE